MNKFQKLYAVLVGSLLLVSNSYAAISTTEVLAVIADAVTFIAVVGLAVLGMLAGAKVFKWARAAL